MSTGTRASWRDLAAIAAGVGALAVAVWLIPASVVIVRWTAVGPTRVALLPALDRLGWLAVAAVAGIGNLFLWFGRDRSVIARTATCLAPLALLWLWAVPYVPWLPDRIPLLLVLAGPIRWVVAAVAGAAAVDRFVHVGPALETLWPRIGRKTIFAVSLAVYATFGTLSVRATGIGGDEPHYLMIAQSLLVDHDLQIENNHDRKEYRAFYGGPLKPDFMARGRNGVIYSIHAPGLSVLLLPFYAVGGYVAALLAMWTMAAFVALAIFDLADTIAGRRAALFTWASTALTIPFMPAAWLIYPETAGALIAAWAAFWIWKPLEVPTRTWVWRGAVLGALPWFHTKFAVFLGIFAVALAFRLRHRRQALVALAAPIAISLAGWFWFFFVLYGAFDPQAPYGDYTLQVHPRNIPRSVLGLLFDQKFGLLTYSPMYIAVAAGCWRLVRQQDTRYLGLTLIATIATYTLSTARIYLWWGGSSAPARFLVPIVPLLAPMIAVAAADTRRSWARPLFGLWLLAGVAVTIVAASMPDRRLFYSDPHGVAKMFSLVEAGAPLTGTYPTFTVPDWRTPLVALLPWLAAGAASILAVRVAARRFVTPLTLATIGVCVFLVVAGLGTARPEAAVRDATAQRGSLDLIWRWDPAELLAFEYGRNRPVDAARLHDLTVIALAGPEAPVSLPAGAYEARVWFTGAGAREGEVLVTSQQHAVFGRQAGAMQNPTAVPFELPSDAPRVAVSVRDDRLAARVANAEIVPRAVAPYSERDNRTVRAIESVVDYPGAYIVYLDTTTYPEGGVFWTRGTDRANILIAPAGASHLTLTMFLGPLTGAVRVTVAGKEMAVHVPANGTTELEADLPAGVRLVPVEIQAPGQFHPSDVDPNSVDTRRLGCQVRVSLE